MTRRVLCLVVLAGCGVPPLPLDQSKLVEGPAGGALAAESTCAFFGVTDCPAVYWYGPESMNCDDGLGFTDITSGICVSGLQGSDGILLAMAHDSDKPSDTPLVHEIAHWWRGDEFHTYRGQGRTWGGANGLDNYELGTQVGDQNAALVEGGL